MEKLNSLKVAQVLKEKGVSFFAPLDFQRIFGVPFFVSKNFIHRHIQTGLFTKVKNGLYVFSQNSPPKFILANRLYQPSYVSFESALSYYHIIPETIYTVFSVTTKASRNFEVMNTQYIYHRVKKEFFFDYNAEKIDGLTFLIAGPEKALVDYLYFVVLKKKSLNERIELARIPRRNLIKIAKLYKRRALLELIDRLYD